MGKIIRNGVEYSGATEDATAVNYDNSLSGLNAQTVQEAVDELTESLSDFEQVTTSSKFTYNIAKIGKQRIISIYGNGDQSDTTNLFTLSEDNRPKSNIKGVVTLMDSVGATSGAMIYINTEGSVTTSISTKSKVAYAVLVYEVA